MSEHDPENFYDRFHDEPGAYERWRYGDPLTAFDLIDYDGPLYIRIVGGRTLYESVQIGRSYDDGNVRLVRLQTLPGMKLRQINRYVSPDTPVELVRKPTEEDR